MDRTALSADLARANDQTAGIDHPLLKTANPSAPAAFLVVTSNRGLCGGYNANILHTASDSLEGLGGGLR